MRAFLLLVISFFVFLSCAHEGRKLCDNIFLKEGELKLGRNEQILVCGSSSASEGWKDVPLPQAQYQIKILLQEKGYLTPRFERVKDQLFVWSGPRSEFSGLEVRGAKGILDGSKKRQVKGEPITRDKLDEVTQWADTEMRSKGYACPELDVKAQAWNGRMIVTADPGRKDKIATIRREGLSGLHEAALERYQAFDVGDDYDVRETQLTVSRMLQDGLVQSAYFTTKCRGDLVDLYLRGTLGPARLLQFGVGASTEEFPFTIATFRNTKLDERASNFEARLYASPKQQNLTVSSELYWLPWTDQTYFGPRFRLARKSEHYLEELQAKLGADLGRHWDWWNIRWGARFGPTLNYVNTVRGIGPDEVRFLSWEGSVKAMSHLYEIGIRNQFSGWDAEFNYEGQRKGIGSYINVDRYQLDFRNLWNVGNFSPPFFVLGARTQLIGVDTSPPVLGQSRHLLPSEYRIFYGGDDNLRGFGRHVLNNGDAGYLSAAYAGLELRLVKEVPWNLEPFLLYDVAKLGDQRYNLDEPLFTSWGLGLRWASPIGTVRGSAARGEILNEDARAQAYPEEWVFFFSFGQEF